MEYFYSRLFTANPDCRTLFPTSMTAQRERMFAALARLVWSLDNQPGCAELLGQLARDHRRFGVTQAHYRTFFTALRDTAEHFIGSGWTPEIASAWSVALDYISATMQAAAAAEAQGVPAVVGRRDRLARAARAGRRGDPAAPERAAAVPAGQYVPVQVTKWPRAWRPYSIANAPRPGGLIELHVRAIPGGQVSNTLVHHSVAGETVLLGAADGAMTMADSERDLLCVAGGTGLAPIKALIEQVLAPSAEADQERRPRKITLFVGRAPALRPVRPGGPAAARVLVPGAAACCRCSPTSPATTGCRGLLPDVVSGHGLFENTDAYICGPPAMVTMTAALLAASLPPGQIHHDPIR